MATQDLLFDIVCVCWHLMHTSPAVTVINSGAEQRHEHAQKPNAQNVEQIEKAVICNVSSICMRAKHTNEDTRQESAADEKSNISSQHLKQHHQFTNITTSRV